MKIGLLTYHHSVNNGAMMQTYATCRALKELGHDVVIVDIRQPEKRNHGISSMITSLWCIKRDNEINKFKKQFYPPLTRRYYSVDELRKNPPEVDCLIVGSDQTWNPDIAKEMTMAYFLDFGSDKLKRISYASSFGISEWPTDSTITSDVQNALDRFNSISVRESTGVDLLKKTFGKQGTLVVDPTMLFESFPELTREIKQRQEILCYKLYRNSDFYNNIGEVKRQLKMPARLLNNLTPVKGLRYTYPPSVSEWIERIGGAGFVITDSFHGTVFSLLYKRQFAVIRNHNSRESRYRDLLNQLGVGNRLFDSVEQLSKMASTLEPIDYSLVTPKISMLRQSSWDYLKQALSE